MKNLKKLIIPVLMFFLIANLTSCTYQSNSNFPYPFHQIISAVDGVDKKPQAIFLRAWNSIAEEFLDPTYNNQNWSRWKTRYLGRIQTYDDAHVAIDTMLESLDDPYTRFLTKSDFAEQNRNIDARLFGIGVHIAQRKNKIFIINIINGTPAQKAGLKAGDVILKVNNTPTKGLDIKDVADMVRGKAGSTVKLTVQRGKQVLVKTVQRKEINIKTVEYKMLDNNYAYIKITSFISHDTALEVAQALEKTKKSEGIILDVRGNFGGLLPNAVLIANMFINKGSIVSIVDRDGYKEDLTADNSILMSEKPLVILINEASASASEILSGALKDHRRATLVGERTFGKGLVQKIIELPDGSGLNVTIAKYLTPNGTDINKVGISPDVTVKMTEKDFLANKDPQLARAKQVLKAKVDNNNRVAKLRKAS